MTELVSIASTAAPAAVGPYVQAVAHRGVLYCSGSLPLNPATGTIDATDIAAEARQCLTNLAAVCQAAGTDLDRALRMTVYTTKLRSFADINTTYAEFFEARCPARTTIEVAALPLGATVEIDAIVALP
ncbi:Rid family detoxifying hydrolase [Mycobacterium sp. smrl_JER01]|uniref:Rid family detoxifying hydrolase n=1 Tax=Mycobacterium sp. smrl_JER01 TaxID=3402633 RepID=UPI003ACBA00D